MASQPHDDSRAFPSPIGVIRLSRWLGRQLHRFASTPPVGIVLWDGQAVCPAPTAPVAWLKINEPRALLKLLLDGEAQFGDLYSDGAVDVSGNLVEFLEILYQRKADRGLGVLGRSRHLLRRLRMGRIASDRDDITHHYDLDGEFYEQWLDREAMQYTCAYFPTADLTLEAAQTAKMHYICRKLRLRPGQCVIEAGCGWGGLARFMVRHYGVSVKAYNISPSQIGYARSRAREQGLEHRVAFIEDDFHNIRGSCDAFVSVGMLEHVGVGRYVELGRVVDRCLNDDGVGLIHTIGRDKPAATNAWIQRRIFPGAYAPTLREMMRIFEPWSLSVVDIENLRLHYAKTLAHWLMRYEARAQWVRSHYGEPFFRAWRLYLSGSLAAFNAGDLQLFQLLFCRPSSKSLPLSRSYLYYGPGFAV